MNGSRMRGQGFPDGIFYHWIWAHVKGSKVFLTVKEIDGPMGQGRMFKAEDWDSMNGGPAFNIADPPCPSTRDLTRKPGNKASYTVNLPSSPWSNAKSVRITNQGFQGFH